MARYVDPDVPGPVIELGSGTGVVTAELVAKGIDPSRLLLVEFNPSFCRLLRKRYPEATVIQGDAYRIKHLLSGYLREPAAALVHSSVPNEPVGADHSSPAAAGAAAAAAGTSNSLVAACSSFWISSGSR